MTASNIKIFSTSETLFQAAAQDFAERSTQAVQKKGWCHVVLSGGNTPKNFYTALIEHKTFQTEIPWHKIRFFFGDERYVPSNDPQSNYYTAQQFLFSKLSIPKENIYRIPTEFKTAAAAAKHYEKTLLQCFPLKNSEWPIFDIVYLGMGDNGHTASWMPFTDIVNDYIQEPELSGWVKSLWVESLKMYRITLTPPAINHSDYIAFLVEGENKAPALKAVLQDKKNPLQYPALLIQNAVWYVDQAAASQLEK